MPAQLTPEQTLDHLKKEAKLWLKALRAGAPDARERLDRAIPRAPQAPTLREVQHAIARERGFDGWTALKGAILEGSSAAGSTHALIHRFLENACPDHHVRGASQHVRARHTAMRLLTRHPEIARHDFYTAVVCGDLEAVKRRLAEQPTPANAKSGAQSPDRAMAGGAADLDRDIGGKGWEPLLYLCFTRLPLDAVTDKAVEIARLLLEHGADPNVFFMAGDSRYTPLVGAVGEGEEDRPPHQQRDALVRLLLDAGAEPYDNQVLYNLGFKADYRWYLPLIHQRSLQLGRQADWDDPEWQMLGMGSYGPGAPWLLDHAIKKDDVPLVRWCLEHGANPDSPPAADKRFLKASLYEKAVRLGRHEIAELLAQYGAPRISVTLTPVEALVAASFRLDRSAARVLLDAHPELRGSPQPLFAASKANRPDAVELLLDLGMSPDVADAANQRPLHMAAYANAVDAARVLIGRGAEIDPVEDHYGNTPIGGASYYRHREMIDLLASHSRNVWSLTHQGKIDRLRDVLAGQPGLARIVGDGYTLLMWLPPDDEHVAIEIARLLVERGADPTLRGKDGLTAADRADRLGMDHLAGYLRTVAASAASRIAGRRGRRSPT
jgi:ankyrin repeat protein